MLLIYMLTTFCIIHEKNIYAESGKSGAGGTNVWYTNVWITIMAPT